MGNQTDRFAGFSPQEKRALLAELLRKRNAGKTAECPLSYGQKAMLYLSGFDRNASTYNTMFAIRVRAELNIESLRAAFQEIIDRHAVLRTTYDMKGEQFLQQIHEAPEADFAAFDASNWDEDYLEARSVEDASRPYDLKRDSVIRLRLYSRSRESHVLMLGVHHIAFDYWSYDVFCRELIAMYSAKRKSTQVGLSPLKFQFRDFVQWQRDLLASPRGEKVFRYWQGELAGEVPVLNLPSDRARQTVQSYNGSSLNFTLDTRLVESLCLLANERNVTLYVLVLAAFQVLLHQYTGQNDILVGSPMVCRDLVQFEDLIGYFSNVVPLRANLAGDPLFTTLVGEVRAKVLGALEHQHYPLPLLVERIAPRRDPSRSPLLDVLFGWEKSRDRAPLHVIPDAEKIQVPLRLDLLYARQLGAPNDLTFMVFEGRTSLSGTFLYNTDLFERERIVRMATHFQNLLQGILDNPSQRVSRFSLVTPGERKRILTDWNSTASAYPRERVISELFEHQVAARPEAVAVEFGDNRLTYGELNARANQLARYLRKQGAREATLVGVSLERSCELIVALLAVLKAGAAYLPLDASYPEERLRFMIEDTHTLLLVTTSALAGRLPAKSSRLVLLDQEAEQIEAESGANFCSGAGPESLAYVMYTSGSTGQPKGIEIRQRSVLRLVRNTDYVELGSEDVMAQVSNTSFDAATFEIWGALLNGAKLVGFPKELLLSPADLEERLRRENVSTLFLTTAVAHQIGRERPDALKDVKQVLFGGEAVNPRWVGRILEAGGPKRLVHVYGPTETTTFATWYEVRSVQERAITIPIGRPIANTRVYLLDGEREPVGVGLAGELYIGGDGVARGYWNRPELTAERFVDDRFCGDGGKLYRSGDLGRYREDGAIEFVGRADQQVKIRGYRIELEEIAAIVERHECVQAAQVIARGRDGGEKTLVGYVVAKPGAPLDREDIRRWLKEKLPDYMVPSVWVELEKFPLNANGKIDQAALPEPQEEARQQEGFAPPESEPERVIAEIWQRALKRAQVGRHDNFFDIGGHSLLVAQVHAELQKAFGRVPIVDLFRFPTISLLARRLADSDQSQNTLQEVRDRAKRQKTVLAQRASIARQRRGIDSSNDQL